MASFPLSLPGGPLQAWKAVRFAVGFILQKGRLRTSSRDPFVNKNRMTFVIRPSMLAVRGGFEPPVRLPVRQFSKLVVSATHPSHQADLFSEQDCKDINKFGESPNKYSKSLTALQYSRAFRCLPGYSSSCNSP